MFLFIYSKRKESVSVPLFRGDCSSIHIAQCTSGQHIVLLRCSNFNFPLLVRSSYYSSIQRKNKALEQKHYLPSQASIKNHFTSNRGWMAKRVTFHLRSIFQDNVCCLCLKKQIHNSQQNTKHETRLVEKNPKIQYTNLLNKCTIQLMKPHCLDSELLFCYLSLFF